MNDCDYMNKFEYEVFRFDSSFLNIPHNVCTKAEKKVICALENLGFTLTLSIDRNEVIVSTKNREDFDLTDIRENKKGE